MPDSVTPDPSVPDRLASGSAGSDPAASDRVDPDLVDAARIAAAHDRIRPYVVRTPLLELGDSGVILKAENLQPSGAFKLRGASNSMLNLDVDQRRRGVVAHSSGNHAIAVAHVGRSLGIRTVVVMPSDAPQAKIDRTRDLGAVVELVAPDSSARTARARELAESDGLVAVEPYDSELVLAATATISTEILEDLPAAQTDPPVIYVPVSGGGLAGGVALGAKLRDPRVRVVGVEPELAADALASRQAGRRVAFSGEQMRRTLADGLRVQQVGAVTWPYLQTYLDDIVTVTEQEMLDAMRRIALEAWLVAEPSGAVSVAAALAGRGRVASASQGTSTGQGTSAARGTSRGRVGSGGQRVSASQRAVAIVTGGNVDPGLFADVLAGRLHG